MADQSNTALSTMKGVTWACVLIGAVLTVMGLVGHDVTVGSTFFSTTVHETSYGKLITGASLLGIGFQAWLLLLLFWAVQTDRATRPSYVEPVRAPSAPSSPARPNRVQREAAAAAAKVRPIAWNDEG